jgi:hypothetical protein
MRGDHKRSLFSERVPVRPILTATADAGRRTNPTPQTAKTTA